MWIHFDKVIIKERVGMDIEAVTPIQEFIAKGGWLPILVFMLASIYGLINQGAKPEARKLTKIDRWILTWKFGWRFWILFLGIPFLLFGLFYVYWILGGPSPFNK
jgi:hypothetical protein